ncbi:hypothetical protein [Corallococcus sp. Z5C101001]|uniref:hypothetical protein n=1 Tax=Corallococcus sp. Z5C101001 TaxID=2596829 RepID=UPI00117D4904|nr:hypothetical protein [Corallococcus sp. Z5C101001]TSC27595.1 hypothetical protein FOF48_19470 [Corallococcus sp. Z5C101001]
MAGPDGSLPGARCARHPDAAAVAMCARCGGFLCGACTEVQGETAYCEPCVAWLARHGRPSRAVVVLLGANVVGLVLLTRPPLLTVGTLLAGVLGSLQATRELRRIARGEAAPGGRLPAWVLRCLAAVNLLGVGAWIALGVFALFSFRRQG